MADAKYGRLFTEADVRALMGWAWKLGATAYDLPRDAVEAYERVRGEIPGALPPSHSPLTFPADEPLFLLRGQDRAITGTLAAYYALLCGMTGMTGARKVHVSAVVGCIIEIAQWQREHPDRVKVPD